MNMHANSVEMSLFRVSFLERFHCTYIHTGQLYMENGIEVEKEDDDECIIEDGTDIASNDTGTGKYTTQPASDKQFSGPVGIQSHGRLPQPAYRRLYYICMHVRINKLKQVQYGHAVNAGPPILYSRNIPKTLNSVIKWFIAGSPFFTLPIYGTYITRLCNCSLLSS